jgi:hypothetical protein
VFIDVMRYTIALNGSFFTAQRMLHEYAIKAYGLEPSAQLPPTPCRPDQARRQGGGGAGG